jgi:hypothetical protein
MNAELGHGIDRFTVTQKLTLMVNRYEIRSVAGDGQPGHLLAVAQQKRAAFKEQVTFYQDESRTTPLFSFKARQRLDLGATYDVLDADGQPIGSFRKTLASRCCDRPGTWKRPGSRSPEVNAASASPSAGAYGKRHLWETRSPRPSASTSTLSTRTGKCS